jgi:hypothetical protein
MKAKLLKAFRSNIEYKFTKTGVYVRYTDSGHAGTGEVTNLDSIYSFIAFVLKTNAMDSLFESSLFNIDWIKYMRQHYQKHEKIRNESYWNSI